MRSTHRHLLIALLLLPLTASALESDKDQPIYVEADSADINDATGVSVYQGNVVVTQGTIKLEADRITIYQVDGETDKLEADGQPVKFRQQTDDGQQIRARSKHAEYKVASEILYMTGDAVLFQGKDTFRSDRIVYDRVKAKVRAGASANGKQRVRIAIQPKKGGKQANKAKQ